LCYVVGNVTAFCLPKRYVQVQT